MTAAVRPQEAVQGLPRVGPVPSATSDIQGLLRASQSLSLRMYPWQKHALQVMTSRRADGKWQHSEVAIITARQNGKTSMLMPRIVDGLQRGEKILHAAQTREISREVFLRLGPTAPPTWDVRYGSGQESIRTPEGGVYRVVAAQRGARGLSADLLIIDELREFEDFDFIAAAAPTLTASGNPQTLYVSNAGTERSVVLNDLRNRQEELAYMEWSAAGHRTVDDEEGWLEANPAIGHGNMTLDRIRAFYDRYEAAGELAIFETEHLCRWVKSMMPRLVQDTAWQQCRGTIETPRNPSMGISVDPNGRRASAVIAWPQSDGSIAVTVSAEVTGNPINIVDLAVDLVAQAQAQGVSVVGFDPWTDQHLARHFPNTEGINGQEFANASERFVSAVETQGLRWQYADSISSDLPYVARKLTTGRSYMADRADPDRSVTAALAAIRAVWLASNPQVQVPSVY